MLRPAHAPMSPTAPANTTHVPATDAAPEVGVRPDGSITGIDGMLDQISASLARQIVPAIRDTVVPVLQNDRQLQTTVGRAAGAEIGRQLAGPLWTLAIIAGVYAGWKIYRLSAQSANRPKVVR